MAIVNGRVFADQTLQLSGSGVTSTGCPLGYEILWDNLFICTSIDCLDQSYLFQLQRQKSLVYKSKDRSSLTI